MLTLNSEHPAIRSLHHLLPPLVLALALAACNGADSPLGPPDGSTVPASEPLAAGGGAATPDYSLAPATGRIVFQSYRSGSGDIYRMDPLGTTLVRLTTSVDEERVPSWSYDNKRIALVRPRLDANNTKHDDIYIINSDGSGGHWARAVPSPWHLGDPSWSPDGSRLLVTVTVSYTWYVGWMDLATGQIGLFNGGGFNYPGLKASYDRSGQKIVYVGSGSKTVEQINADGTGHKVLVSSTFVSRPAYSPDGKKVAYSRLISTGDEELFVKNLVDGTTRRMTWSAKDDNSPTWSPDGSRIAFTSRRSGLLQIWTMNAATGGSLTQITHTANAELYPQWSH